MKNLTDYPQRTSMPKLILAIIIAYGFSFSAYGQNAQPVYSMVSMMKVPQDGGSDYINLERKIWKPVHQELLKQGKIIGWYLYRVQYAGSGDEFNYVTVTHFVGNESLDDLNYGEIFEVVHPNVPGNIIFEQTMESRELVSSRLLQWNLQSFPEEQREPSRYAVVNYQKSVPGKNYFALRRDHVKPAFDLAVKEGKIAGWGLWSTMFPGGSGLPYNWVSADFYNKMSEIGQYGWADMIKRANPNENMDKLMPKMGESRMMVRRELWELIDYTR